MEPSSTSFVGSILASPLARLVKTGVKCLLQSDLRLFFERVSAGICVDPTIRMGLRKCLLTVVLTVSGRRSRRIALVETIESRSLADTIDPVPDKPGRSTGPNSANH